jgi:2-methylaconitate cis-trans-isomerase PrpF
MRALFSVGDLTMAQSRLRATFMRGGTSKAVVFHAADLPSDRSKWDAIFLAIMGSPDPNGRQLDGMGGGLSSVSKVCVVGPPSRPDADIDYTFAQVSVKEAVVDYSGNCGNMASAMGPFAVDEGVVPRPTGPNAVVRIHNTNTGTIIHSRFAMDGNCAATAGSLEIDGVGGTGAPIRLEFINPGGSRTGRLLPSGRPRDTLDVDGLGPVEVSLVDAANPCVFVHASSLGKSGNELPEALERDSRCMELLEAIRRAASVAMGLSANREVASRMIGAPRIALVSGPQSAKTLSGRPVEAGDMAITIRMISAGQPHRAVPVTGATCLAIACRINGTIPHEIAGHSREHIRIGHPSGLITVDADVERADDPSSARANFGALYRTARRLFDGHVYYDL